MKYSGDQTRALATRLKHAAWLLPATLCAAQGAQAAPADSRVNIRQPITVTKTADLDFGDFVAGTGNSIFRINPSTGVLSQRSGDAISMGGTHSAASFDVTGTPNLRVQITRNQNRIFIVRDGGAETMRVNRFRYDRRRKRLNASGQQTFGVGGQLRIRPNQAPGTYRGTFDVTVEYF